MAADRRGGKMPFSWIRVPNHESKRFHDDLPKDYDYARRDFVNRVERYVNDNGGADAKAYYELNGEWVRVIFRWQAEEWLKKETIVAFLQGQDEVVLVEPEEANLIHPPSNDGPAA
jgi:hypothetical protein